MRCAPKSPKNTRFVISNFLRFLFLPFSLYLSCAIPFLHDSFSANRLYCFREKFTRLLLGTTKLYRCDSGVHLIYQMCVCVFVYFRTIRDIRKTSTVLSKCVPQCSHHMKNWIYYLFGDIERTASLVLLFFFLSPANHSKLYVRFE